MDKEFNLSERLIKCDSQLLAEDVKEFIKRLKEFINRRAKGIELNKNNPRASIDWAIIELSNVLYYLDKLAGDKLK